MSFRFVALVLVACACAPAPSGVLTGRAIFEGEADHAGIVVSASGKSQASTVTDADGRFTLRGLSSGRISVVFAATDAIEATQVRVAEAGAELAEVVFRPTGRVSGVVIDATTLGPIQGALILSTGGTAAASSAADGSFTLGGIRTGEATVVVSFSGLGPQQKLVRLERGKPLGLGTIALGPAPLDEGPTAISGQVVFADGAPAPAATVRIKGALVDRQTQTGADGKFRFEQVRAGLVSLEAVTGSAGATLPNVLAIEGTSGMIIAAGGLYPLGANPIELTRGRHLTDLTSGTITPDGQTLLGVSASFNARNIRAVPLDGGPQVELLTAEEVGLSTPGVAAIGTDSTTVAIGLNEPSSGGYERQLFLASTLSAGRQLISDRACPIGASGDSFIFIEGATCRAGGQLAMTPLKFGAPPSMLGTLSSAYLQDLAHQQLVDVVPRPAPEKTSDVDLLKVGPQPSRQRVATNVARVSELSPDGKHLTYFQTYATVTSPGAFDLVTLDTGAVLHLSQQSVTTTFTSTGKVVTSTWDGPVDVFDLQSGVKTHLADQVSTLWMTPDGASAFLFRKRSDSDLGTLSKVSVSGGAETPLGQAVAWYAGSPDGAWLYFIEGLDLASHRGRLMRVALGGGAAVLLDADASYQPSHPPQFSGAGEFLAYVQRTGEAFGAVCFDAVKGTSAVLATLEEPQTWQWKFSPGARYLAYGSLAGAPKVLNVQRPSGGPHLPVAGESQIVWLTDRTALIQRYSARPWSGAGGTYHATFE